MLVEVEVEGAGDRRPAWDVCLYLHSFGVGGIHAHSARLTFGERRIQLLITWIGGNVPCLWNLFLSSTTQVISSSRQSVTDVQG